MTPAVARKRKRFQCRTVKECDHGVRDLCACGEAFAIHGAGHPHQRGDECPGFRPATEKGTRAK